MLVLEVAQLMGQHGVHLGGAELLEQGVVKHDAFGRAETGEVGIGVSRALAAVHHKQALGSKATTLHQRGDPCLERFVFKRLELIEQWRDHGRKQHQHQQVEGHPDAPGPEPPHAARAAHEPQNQRDDGQADDQTDQRGLQQIGQPEPERHFVEAEPFFKPEGGVQSEGQVEQAADEAKRSQQGQLRHQAAVSRQAGTHQRLIQRVNAAEQGPAQQDGGAESHLQHAETGFGDGVIRCLLVRHQ